ncbi:MAG: HAD hydrolase family protein [Planctomycetes bacterium]|nr:HAD hydrolase family protein [Planctomycetota bacterium]
MPSVPGRPLPSQAALAAIEFLLLDVDGVLTDGRIWFDPHGDEYKQFHVHDAAGLHYWHRAGGRTGFLSGRGGHAVERRARELGVHDVILKRVDKLRAFEELLRRHSLRPENIAYVGDDVVDLPVLRVCGYAVTVPEARPDVFPHVHRITGRSSGFGAVRDVIEDLLRARGVWQAVLDKDGRS